MEDPSKLKIGTVKNGYKVINNANVKVWQPVDSITKWYSDDMPAINKMNWSKWLSRLTANQKKSIEKIKASYGDLRALGFIVVEVVRPLAKAGFYYADYAWDYAQEIYKDIFKNPEACIIFVYDLDRNSHLHGDINVQHVHITHNNKKTFLAYKKLYNAKPYGSIQWSGRQDAVITFKI